MVVVVVVVAVVMIYNIYIIYIGVKPLSRFRSDFFEKQIYQVICIINFKNTLFKGSTRGDPWAPSLVKQTFHMTQ
jgi:hypothetical protein